MNNKKSGEIDKYKEEKSRHLNQERKSPESTENLPVQIPSFYFTTFRSEVAHEKSAQRQHNFLVTVEVHAS
jgi:hypothetical protein